MSGPTICCTFAIYPTNDQDSAAAFLLALRAKGYHPQVIVTDLRQDYGPVIAQVFPQAVHHECIFHALQRAHKHVKDAYGPRPCRRNTPKPRNSSSRSIASAAIPLALATERYTAVVARRQDYVQARPEAARASLTSWSAIGPSWPTASTPALIPATNNTVERVIGRFDQHYQNFCGFESIADAQRYLAVFEKLYRCTPFSQDAQPTIRGKCPLQLAGYDISQLPMTTLYAGLSIVWPATNTGGRMCPQHVTVSTPAGCRTDRIVI